MIRIFPIIWILTAMCYSAFSGTKEDASHQQVDGIVQSDLHFDGKYMTVGLSNVKATTGPTTMPTDIFDASIHGQSVEGVQTQHGVKLRLFGSYEYVCNFPRPTTTDVLVPQANGVEQAIVEAGNKIGSVVEVGEILTQMPDALLGARSDKNKEVAEKAKSLAEYLGDGPRSFTLYTKEGAFEVTLTPKSQWKKVFAGGN